MSISTNANMNTSDSSESFKWTFQTISVLTICTIITILTLLGNGLVLLSIKFRLRARSYSDYFIVSLCLADFFVGLFVMPLMTVHSLYLRWPFHYRLCYVWMSIDFTCSTASFLTLASMALDRYWALTAPYFHLRNRSRSSILIFIISSWVIPFAIWPSSIFVAHHYITEQPSCVHPARPFIIVILCAFFYYIPLLFMLACYSRIIVNIKNIEVLIRGTWETGKVNSSANDFKTSIRSSTSLMNASDCNEKTWSSLSSMLYKYFARHRTTQSPIKSSPRTHQRSFVVKEIGITRQDSTDYHHIIPKKRRSAPTNPSVKVNTSPTNANRRAVRQTTTATFTGQKRCSNEPMEENKLKKDTNIQQDDDQLIRVRLSTRTSSLPAARCVSYYYNQQQNPTQTITTKAIIEDQHQDTLNAHHCRTSRLSLMNNERNRSHSHSSAQCGANGAAGGGIAAPINASGHSSSFEQTPEDEHHRVNHRTPPSRLSTPFNSSRYSQLAVAQFMHERHKARLRRNQKASRMLGILLAVFLICWLPFTISYPMMIFYPGEFPGALQCIIFWFGYANSLLNPFLYVYSSRNFRRAILETLCCCCGRMRSRQHLRYQWSFRLDHR